MALNFLPLLVIKVSVGLQKPEIRTWRFYQQWENWSLEFLSCWRGWWDGVNPVLSHCPKNLLPIVFG